MLSCKDPDDSIEHIAKTVDTSCAIAEIAYGHTSPVHQHYIALYTTIMVYLDALDHKHLEAVRQFAARFTKGEKQLFPPLDTLVQLLQQAHELWISGGADAIVSGTIDAVTAMYTEYTTLHLNIKPGATWYPYYLRYRAGIAPPYIHFLFMKSWRPTTESYLQMVP